MILQQDSDIYNNVLYVCYFLFAVSLLIPSLDQNDCIHELIYITKK